MSKKLTQRDEVLQLLKISGDTGVNSYTYRTRWIQLPVRIHELIKLGHDIQKHRNKDGSVNYILKQVLKPIVPPITERSHVIQESFL